MHYLESNSSIIYTAILGAVSLLIWWYRHTYGEKRTPLKDGQTLVRLPGLPIFGYALQLSTDTVLEDFEGMIGKYGEFLEYYIGSRKILLVAEPTAIKEILLARPKIFRREAILDHSAHHANIERSLFFSNGSIWATARKFTSPSFNKVNVHSHVGAIVNLSRQWTDRLKATYCDSQGMNKVIEFKEEALLYTLSVINKVAFGIDSTTGTSSTSTSNISGALDYFTSKRFPADLQVYFTYIVKTVLFPLPISWFQYVPIVSQWEKDTHAATVRLDAAAMEVITQRRKELTDGTRQPDSTLLDTLFRKQEQDAMTDEDLLHNVKVVYLAGSETTSIAISYAVYYLSQHRDILLKVREEANRLFANESKAEEVTVDRVVEELVYTEAVVKEILRLCSPASVISVQLEAGIESHTLSNGLVITENSVIVAYFDGLQKNEKYFEDAKSFKPSRWLDSDKATIERYEANMLAFGYGPRVCPGQRLAMLEAMIAIAALAYEFDMKLACDAKEVRRVLLFTSVPDKLPVTLIPVR